MTLSSLESFFGTAAAAAPWLAELSVAALWLGLQLLPYPAIDAAVRTADIELSLQPLLELAVAAPAVGVAQFLFQCLPDCGV